MRNIDTLKVLMLLCSSALLVGCGGGGGGGGGGDGNPNTNDGPPDAGTTLLDAVTFSPGSGFPQGQDPAEFAVGSGSITARGGAAGSLGLFGLYADDRFAWDFFARDGDGDISFNNLSVVAMDAYWVHPDAQSGGATMIAVFSDGSSQEVATNAVDAGGAFGQPAGFIDTVSAPEGETITSLMFAFPHGRPNG